MRSCWSKCEQPVNIIKSPSRKNFRLGLFIHLFVESRIHIIDVFLIHFVFCQSKALANTINMKWITKEPPTLFFDGILTNSQLFCAFIKVPLQPYSLYWGYAAIFLRIHSLSSAIHQLSSKIWYSIIVAWR